MKAVPTLLAAMLCAAVCTAGRADTLPINCAGYRISFVVGGYPDLKNVFATVAYDKTSVTKTLIGDDSKPVSDSYIDVCTMNFVGTQSPTGTTVPSTAIVYTGINLSPIVLEVTVSDIVAATTITINLQKPRP